MTFLTEKRLNTNRRKLPIIKQAQLSECGHACVAMISQYYGHKIDLLYLRTIQTPPMRGSSMLDSHLTHKAILTGHIF